MATVYMSDKPAVDELTEQDTLVAVMEDGRIRRIRVSDVGIWQQFLSLSGIMDAWVDEDGCLILELDSEYNPCEVTVRSFVSTAIEFEDYAIEADELTLTEAAGSTEALDSAMEICGVYLSFGGYVIPADGSLPDGITARNTSMEVIES